MRENNKRRHPDGSSPRPDLSKLKRQEAVERQTFYDTLSVSQKISELDRKLGVGLGAKKQRARLAAIMEQKIVSIVSADDVKETVEVSNKPRRMKAKERRQKEHGDN